MDGFMTPDDARVLAMTALEPVRGHCSEGYDRAMSEVEDAIVLAYEDGRTAAVVAARPRDLAARIRALATKCAEDLVDEDDDLRASGLREALWHLRDVMRGIERDGRPPMSMIERCASLGGVIGRVFYQVQVIARECEETGQ